MAVTLRELLTDLVGAAATHADGPAAYLAAHGYDLPPDLVAEAVVNFADTTSPEVAEHLAPFVTAHTTGVEPESDWFDLLTTAPVPDDDPDDVDDLDSDPGLDFGAGAVDDLDMLVPTTSDTEDTHDWPSPDVHEHSTESAHSSDDLDALDDVHADDVDSDDEDEDEDDDLD